MFVLNDDLSIYATRGDIVFFTVTAEDEGVPHVFKAGDVVRIKIYGKKDATAISLQKDFPVVKDSESVEIYLSKEDTKIGEVISKPKDYWYEIVVNDDTKPQTIIGYDEDGAKVFKLFPEGKDLPTYIPDAEDIPFVDTELDMTSPRPLQNQAIARAIVQLKAAFEETEEEASTAKEAVAIERERIDNLVAHKVTSLSQNLGYLDAITEETKAKIDATIESDGAFATVKVNLREANLIYGGSTLDLFIIPSECRPIDMGLIHTEDGLEYRISYSETSKRYILSLKAQSSVTVAPSGAGSVTMTYALAHHELIDIRVDADGVTYPTAGEAVRTSIKNLAVGLPIAGEAIGGGYVNGDYGTISDSTFFSHSDYVDVSAYRGCDLILYSCIIQKAGFAFYDEGKNFINGFNEDNTTIAKGSSLQFARATIPDNAYYLRFSMQNSVVSQITQCHAHVLYTGKVAGLMKEYVDRKTSFMLKDITAASLESGLGIHGNNGQASNHELLSASDYIDVSQYRASDIFITCASNGWAGYAFYSANKEYICGACGTSSGIDTGDQHRTYHDFVPVDACYLRYCAFVEKSKIPAAVHVVDITNGLRAVSQEISELKKRAEEPGGKYRYAVDNILCIGDSLTAGAYYAGEFGGKAIKQNYPYYLGRMCACDVTNAGRSGYSASDWYNAFNGKYNFADYDAVIVWLGTNYGCEEMPTDEEINAFVPNSAISASEANQAIYLTKIIETIKATNPDCLILLCNVFASKSGTSSNNAVVAEIAQKYGLQLVDMSDLTVANHPELHAGINNPHFGKAGNIFVADRIATAIHNYIDENPERAEFGVSV